MYGCESWTIKKAEDLTIDAFELWCWRRLLRVPWTARRSNQSILKEINQPWTLIGRTDAEAEVPILGPPSANCPLIGKYPDAGKDWGKEEKWETEDEIVGWCHQLNRHESAHPRACGSEVQPVPHPHLECERTFAVLDIQVVEGGLSAPDLI